MLDEPSEATLQLVNRIRQLARRGLNRTEIHQALVDKGTALSLDRVRKIVRHFGIAVARHKPASFLSSAHKQASDYLQREVAEAKRVAGPPYKNGPWEDWR